MNSEQLPDGSGETARYTHGHSAAVLSAHSRRGAADSAAGAALSFLRLRLKKGLTHPRYRYCNRNSAYRADRPQTKPPSHIRTQG